MPIKSINSSELTIYAVVTIPEDPREATLNLMAPIVINERGRRGRQVILHESKYSVRHPLVSAEQEAEDTNPDDAAENQQTEGNL